MQTPVRDTRAGCEVVRITTLACLQQQSAPSTSVIVPSMVRFEMGESACRKGDLRLTPSLTPSKWRMTWTYAQPLRKPSLHRTKAPAPCESLPQTEETRTLRYLRGDDSMYAALQRLAKLKRSQCLTDIVAGCHTLRYACARFQRDSTSGIQARNLFVFGVKPLIVRSDHDAT